MYRILVADDEVHICQLIQHLVDWEGLHAQLCGVANDGVEAYELIQTQQPHVVISDIRMSGMDGLGLLEQVQRAGIRCAFILVSGYRQFEYAQRAIQLGVTDYLVKPINRQALNSAIRKGIAKVELLREREEPYAEEHPAPPLYRGLSGLKAALETDAEILNRCSFQELAQQNGIAPSSHLQLIYWKAVCGESFSDEALPLLQSRITQTLRTGKWADHSICSRWEQGGVLAAADASTPCVDASLLQRSCQAAAAEFPHWRVILGICEPRPEEPLLQSIRRAQLAAQQHFFQPTETCFSTGPAKASPRLTDLSDQLNLVPLLDAMKLLDSDSVLSLAQEGFHRLQKPESASLLFDYAGWLVDSMNHALSAFTASRSGLEKVQYLHRSELLEQLDHCPSLLSFSARVCESLEGCIRETRSAIEQLENKPVRVVRDMVESRYMEHISLNDAAEAADLNPVYLSALFKKETGINFKDYLTNARMEKAKELLRQGESINRVSELVGYQDTKYFSRLFARVVGVNPTQYKKLYH